MNTTDVGTHEFVTLLKEIKDAIESDHNATSIASITALILSVTALFTLTAQVSIKSFKVAFRFFFRGSSEWLENLFGPGADRALYKLMRDQKYNKAFYRHQKRIGFYLLEDITIFHPDLQDPEIINISVKGVKPYIYGIKDPYERYNYEQSEFELPEFVPGMEGLGQKAPWTETKEFLANVDWKRRSPRWTAFHFIEYLQHRQSDLSKDRKSLKDYKIFDGRFALPFNASAYFRASLKVMGKYKVGANGSVDFWLPWGNTNFKIQDGQLVATYNKYGPAKLYGTIEMLPCKELVLKGDIDPLFQMKFEDINKLGSILSAYYIHMFPQVLRNLYQLVEFALPRAIEPQIIHELNECSTFKNGDPIENRFKERIGLLKDRLDLKNLRKDIDPPFDGQATLEMFDKIKRLTEGENPNEEQNRLRIWLANVSLIAERLNVIPQIVKELEIDTNKEAWFV